MKIQKHQELHV